MQNALQTALRDMKAALAILDNAEAPADVGAHLDLAISRLEAVLSQMGSEALEMASK
jgi:hypothetical protein